jgi:hypothetical protein
MRHTLATLALATTLPALLAAQTAPTRTLTKPDAEWTEPFSAITGIRELKNGGVIVADNRDKTIQLVDFKGAAKRIGREGSGPGEYGLPMSVFGAPGDTTWVFDMMNSRYLVIDPSGKPVSTFMMDQGAQPGGDLGRGGRIAAIGMGLAQGIDAQGRLYFRAPKVRFGDEAPATIDTTPILRWDRKANRTDTVGLLFAPAGPPATVRGTPGSGEVRVTMRIGGSTPFQSTDAYAVTPAGDVAVVRARDYHVDWIVKGRTVSGQPIPYERVRVTDADKKSFIENRRNAGGIQITNDNGRSSVRTGGPPPNEPPPEFPEFKGPFAAGGVAAAPNGQIWVSRHVASDAPPTYDVIDNSGKVVSRVVLPKRTRLVGFGNGTVYLARIDEDDLQYLQRYRW